MATLQIEQLIGREDAKRRFAFSLRAEGTKGEGGRPEMLIPIF